MRARPVLKSSSWAASLFPARPALSPRLLCPSIPSKPPGGSTSKRTRIQAVLASTCTTSVPPPVLHQAGQLGRAGTEHVRVHVELKDIVGHVVFGSRPKRFRTNCRNLGSRNCMKRNEKSGRRSRRGRRKGWRRRAKPRLETDGEKGWMEQRLKDECPHSGWSQWEEQS